MLGRERERGEGRECWREMKETYVAFLYEPGNMGFAGLSAGSGF